MNTDNMAAIGRIGFLACGLFAANASFADTQNWGANPASGEWSTTAANWEGGLAWTPTNKAVFGESTQKSIQIPANVIVNGLQVTADGYRFFGEGAIATPITGRVSATTQYQTATVEEGVTAHVDVPFAGVSQNSTFTKSGAGSLVVSRDMNFLRVMVEEGTLVASNCLIEAAKIYKEYSKSSTLVLDGVALRPMNNNVILGDLANVFVGAGGIATTNSLATGVTDIRIKQSIAPRPDLDGAVDGGLTHAGRFNLWIDSTNNTFAGGCNFLAGSAYLACPEGLGFGPVALNAPLYARETMTITNDVVIGDGGVLGVSNQTATLTVERPSFSNDATRRVATLTSVAGGGRVRFDNGSEPFSASGCVLSNGVDFVADGATLKASADWYAPFVRSLGGTSCFVLGNGGCEFDTDGNDVAIKVPFAIDPPSVTTNITEINTAFSNYSFESGGTGWTFGAGYSGAGSAQANTSAFVNKYPDYKTPYGSYFAVVRASGVKNNEYKIGSLSQNFTVDADGEYRVVFDFECRPEYDVNGELAFSVSLNEGAADEMILRSMSSAPGGLQPFQRYESGFVTLEAGKIYAFKITTGESVCTGGSYGLDALFVDRVRLERRDFETSTAGSLSKNGAGTLTVDGLAPTMAATVEAGTLALAANVFESNVVNVANGATLAFRRPYATILNTSFEEDSHLKKNAGVTFSTSAMVEGWTMSQKVQNLTYLSGWQANGSAVSASQPLTTNGTHTAYLRPMTVIETDIVVAQAGEYDLAFEYASRYSSDDYGKGYLLTITASIDGTPAVVVPPRVANGPFARVSERVSLTAGTHRLRIETDDGNGAVPLSGTTGGAMVFIDAVSIAMTEAPSIVDDGTVWNFERGATVDLGGNDIVLGTVKVDGEVVTGGRSSFVAAGLNIVGRGKFRSGQADGMLLIVK